MNDKEILKWADFVASKFSQNHEGWVYRDGAEGIKHIRYKSDYTDYNHWTKRITRAFDWKHLLGTDQVSKAFPAKTPSQRFWGAWGWIVVNLRKDKNLPDGTINGIITHWQEDGQYIAFFQPRVGMKVLDFLREDPDNPHAQAIFEEMRACAELSWPSKETE